MSTSTRTETPSGRPHRQHAPTDAAGGRLVIPFVGRVPEMEMLLAAVNEDPRSAARIVNVSGAPGSGRSRFVDEALARLARLGRPALVVQPALSPGGGAADFFRAVALRLPCGGIGCSNTIARLARLGDSALDEASARALVNAFFQEIYDCGMERRGFVLPKGQRLALVLDDFERLSPAVTLWIAEQVLPLLHEMRGHLDYLLVPVSEHPLASDPGSVAWNALPARFLGVDLPPLSEEEGIEMLSYLARRANDARLCHAIGEGLPGPMLELLRHRLRPLDDMASALDACGAEVAGLLLAVATLGDATEEGLRIVLGPAAASSPVLQQGERFPVPVFGSLRAEGLWLPGAIARLVLEKLGPRFPDVVRRGQEVAGLLDGLEAHFPTEQERRMAARLQPFRFFSRDALLACFGTGEGAELERFARAHPSAFVETPAGNLRFAEGLGALLGRYLRSAGDAQVGAVLDKAAAFWKEREQDLRRQSASSAAHLKALEKERNELFAALKRAREGLEESEQARSNQWKDHLDSEVVRIGASLLANAAGVAFFWVALFSTGQRMTYVVLGTILIGIGFGTPALSRRNNRASRAADMERAQRLRVSQEREGVAMLEARTTGLQQRIAEERRRGEHLAASLEEPCVG